MNTDSTMPENNSKETLINLDRRISKLEKKPKDGWDKLQIILSILIPASVAYAGLFISGAIKDAEIISAEKIAESNREVAKISAHVEQAQLINSFMKTLTSGTPKEEKLAVYAIQYALPEVAPKLLGAVLASGPDSAVKEAVEATLSKWSDWKIKTDVRLVENRFVFTIDAETELPLESQLTGGGRIDFIWFVDADNKRETGQSQSGNDYNIHLHVDENGWGAVVFPVSTVALAHEINSNQREIKWRAEGKHAELSFPATFLPSKSFKWWMEASGLNSSPEWKAKLKLFFYAPERQFSG